MESGTPPPKCRNTDSNGNHLVLFFRTRQGVPSNVRERRRWESNPLLRCCKPPPGRLAPAPRIAMSSPGIEPGPRPSQGRVPSVTPRGRPLPGSRTQPCGFEHRGASATLAGSALARSRTRSPTFGGSCAVRHTPRALHPPRNEQDREDLNPVTQFWRLLPLPGGRSFSAGVGDRGPGDRDRESGDRDRESGAGIGGRGSEN